MRSPRPLLDAGPDLDFCTANRDSLIVADVGSGGARWLKMLLEHGRSRPRRDKSVGDRVGGWTTGDVGDVGRKWC